MSSSFTFQSTLFALIILQVHSDVTAVNGMLGSSVTRHHVYPDLEHPVHVTWNKGKTLLSSWTRRTRATEGMRTVRGIVGDCVMLDLHNYTNRHIHVTWKKGNKQVAKMKGQTVHGSGTYSERFRAFFNGSLSVCPMQPGDEGQYTAEVFGHDGAGLGHQKIQLEYSGNRTAPVQEVTGIVGGSMFLPLAAMDWKDLVQIMWKKDSLLVAELNYSQSDGRSTDRSQILPNGTLRLDRIQESDCGRYSVEVRDRDGKIIYQTMIDVKVEQATVASPVISHLLLFTIVGVHVAVFIVVLGSLIWHFRKCKHRTGRMTNLSFRHVTLGRNGYNEDHVDCGEGDTSSPNQEENGNPASQEPETANSTKQENEAFIKNAKETKAATAASFYTEQPLTLNISTFQGQEEPKSQPRPEHAGNDVVSVTKDGVPLKRGNYIPEDDRDCVPPNFDNCIPPDFDNSVPPDFDNCVPSDFDNFIPPDFDNCVPPDFDNFIPPDFDNCVPPDFDNCIPQDFNNCIPPDFDNCVPPDFDNCVPPDFDHCILPDFDNCIPPDFDNCVPPDFDNCIPPDFDNCVPPDFDNCVPPNFDHCIPPDFDDCDPPAFNDSGPIDGRYYTPGINSDHIPPDFGD
ncbi:uncharacterized protein LOC123347731 [Mauremys mutica]|uniref:Immunoglobulin domain-containing protein n=1 Tax=Mauremys mutica TaxID=74926 RepID=A0A9D3XX20_9SAUR|nr:uncharacterized protein LOC123347731 [Mauremys mutica]KAH1187397.1 hypothetical protein KIL84_020146 [Mauremys mutica]